MPTSKHWVIPNTIPHASPSLKMLYSVQPLNQHSQQLHQIQKETA